MSSHSPGRGGGGDSAGPTPPPPSGPPANSYWGGGGVGGQSASKTEGSAPPAPPAPCPGYRSGALESTPGARRPLSCTICAATAAHTGSRFVFRQCHLEA